MSILSKKQLAELIESEISKQIINSSYRYSELFEPIQYVLEIGGKRLRPILTLMSCNLFTDQITKAIPNALAIEIFHNFSLLHDDIMDDSDLRRNQPTVHKKWNKNAAILSGDAMSIMAYEFIAKNEKNNLPELLTIFNKTALQVCEGQQLDLNFESVDTVSEEDYIEMIELKTSVLIAAALKMGAIAGNASSSDANHLYEFGRNIGLAFQLQDDYLDVYGDTKTFGKKIGGDIVANKKTFLLIKALELAKGDDLTNLKNQIKNTSSDKEQKINEITKIYNQLNVKELSQEKMDEFYSKAIDHLMKVKVDNSKKRELLAIAETLKQRTN